MNMKDKLKDLKRELICADRLLPNSYGTVKTCILAARAKILREIEEIELPFKEELQLCADMDEEDDMVD